MPSPSVERLAVKMAGGSRVSDLLCVPENAIACYVFAQGVRAGSEQTDDQVRDAMVEEMVGWFRRSVADRSR